LSCVLDGAAEGCRALDPLPLKVSSKPKWHVPVQARRRPTSAASLGPSPQAQIPGHERPPAGGAATDKAASPAAASAPAPFPGGVAKSGRVAKTGKVRRGPDEAAAEGDGAGTSLAGAANPAGAKAEGRPGTSRQAPLRKRSRGNPSVLEVVAGDGVQSKKGQARVPPKVAPEGGPSQKGKARGVATRGSRSQKGVAEVPGGGASSPGKSSRSSEERAGQEKGRGWGKGRGGGDEERRGQEEGRQEEKGRDRKRPRTRQETEEEEVLVLDSDSGSEDGGTDAVAKSMLGADEEAGLVGVLDSTREGGQVARAGNKGRASSKKGSCTDEGVAEEAGGEAPTDGGPSKRARICDIELENQLRMAMLVRFFPTFYSTQLYCNVPTCCQACVMFGTDTGQRAQQMHCKHNELDCETVCLASVLLKHVLARLGGSSSALLICKKTA
jgi:hypothetical protein